MTRFSVEEMDRAITKLAATEFEAIAPLALPSWEECASARQKQEEIVRLALALLAHSPAELVEIVRQQPDEIAELMDSARQVEDYHTATARILTCLTTRLMVAMAAVERRAQQANE